MEAGTKRGIENVDGTDEEIQSKKRLQQNVDGTAEVPRKDSPKPQKQVMVESK